MTDPIRAALERLISDIQSLSDSSLGIDGLHQNGDLAQWGELLEGGCYSSWLGDALAAARAALAEPLPPKVGHFVAGEPSDEEFRQLYCDIFDLRCDPASLGPVPVKFARAVIARWGCQSPAEPTPPAVTISALLQPAYEPGDGSADCAQMVNGQWWHPCFGCDSLEIVLNNLLAVPPRPVPVSERLPEPNTKVLAHYFNDLGNGRTICAIWVPAKSRSDDINDDYDNSDHLEYDETDDCYYWPEGWYETIENWDELGYIKVNEGDVIYWQPLPTWPANPTTTGNK